MLRPDLSGIYDLIPKESPCDVRGAMEHTVCALLSTLEIETQPPKSGKFRWILPGVAVAVTAVAVGAAALLSPWAAGATALVFGAVTGLVTQWWTARQKPNVTLRCDQEKLARELKLAAQTLLVEIQQLKPEEETRDGESSCDKEFYRWLQLFALYVKRNGDVSLQKLYFQLKYALESGMGVYIYDELEETDGQLRLPNEDWFLDMRTGPAWTEVLLPVVHTKDKVLMHGHIQ